ncbi:MAG: EAL domain-containing protein [Psychromonas sp.]|nr:EAL domain-containing protein [Alteromonadales bacterium]MCP5079315.1 EAL domain-containing protein [Psychromonas sp.]
MNQKVEPLPLALFTPISPAEFLPVAEETGLIVPIWEWVIEQASSQVRQWEDKGVRFNMAINLSTRQMWHGDIAQQVLEIINKTGVSKDLLEFEITESSMVMDPERMEKILASFQKNDIKISLDDFGTGYSSSIGLSTCPLVY